MKSNLELPDNVTLNFDANGVSVVVSLNIPKELVPFMPKENMHKGKEFNVYSLKMYIPSANISKKNILEVHSILLLKLMSNIRKYKIEWLKHQVRNLKTQLSLFD